MGQLSKICAEYLVDVQSLNKVQGQPFTTSELHETILAARKEIRDNMTDTVCLAPATTKADWTSDQEPRWCPGCGDYSVHGDATHVARVRRTP